MNPKSERRWKSPRKRSAGNIRGLGDVVALVAEPVARLLDATAGTKLVGCRGCAERRAALNAALPIGSATNEKH